MERKPRRGGETGRQLVMILIGSPRGLERSNSAQLSREVLKAFSAGEWDVEWVHTHAVVRQDSECERLIGLVDRAALILLASPLYVDSLPAPTIAALERIAAHRSEMEQAPHVRFAALLNCGFLESEQNITCLQICETFARLANLEWAGGLMVGGGGMTNKRIVEALQTAGSSLASDLPVSGLAQEMLQKPVMPRWMYIRGGNLMWRRQAKKNGLSRKDLRARPYERTD